MLEVLKTEGYIRGYATVEHKDGRNELEIELKYFDGAPVIREIDARVEARPPRLCLGEGSAARSITVSASPSSRRRRA